MSEQVPDTGFLESPAHEGRPPGRRSPAERRERRGPIAGSRLGRLIIGLNLLGLAVLIVGALVLNEFRRGLIEARLDSLNLQAEFVANVLDRAATTGDPAPALDAVAAAETLQLLSISPSERARVFDAQGHVLADSYVVGDRIEQHPLPPARKASDRPPFWSVIRRLGRPPPDVAVRARHELQAEIEGALRTDHAAAIRHGDDGRQVVSVSVPIHHVKAALGVLTLEAGDVDATVWAQRWALLPFIFIAVGVTMASSLLLNNLIARPIERLARAADSVRLSRARAISLPDLAARPDEVGGLTRALESMTDAQSARMDAIERFAADVAHEIKNPLTSMRSAVETLELAPPTHPGREKLMAVLKADVKRLDRLITDIANASRLDAELSRAAPRPIDLRRLLADIVELYGASPRGGAAVRLSSDEGLDAYLVAAREGPLGQVFRNLIDNARSFSPEGGEVRVSLARGPAASTPNARRQVRVQVDDDGPGLPPENLEAVFQRFYTARPKGSAPGGSAFGGHSGLGLSIVRQIVEAHGGGVTAQNRLDDEGRVIGARFEVELPEARR